MYTFLADGEEESERLTYADLDRRARAIAATLEAEHEPPRTGLPPRALLFFHPGLEFVEAFFGCLYAGIVPVPAYPPRGARPRGAVGAIAADARPDLVLTTGALLGRREALLDHLPDLARASWAATREIPDEAAGRWREPPLTGDSLAFLQYTSGSTSTPKGVEVTHRNLMANQEMIRQAFGHDERSVVVGWLPLYHDMGLIGNILQPVYAGGRCHLMAPVAFLQQPLRWLQAIDRYRATTSGGPNFAYEHCLRRVDPAQAAKLDLTCWTTAFNGAEPVRAETLERFAQTFAPAGFDPGSFFPCYGLAEATLLVTGGDRGGPVRTREHPSTPAPSDRSATEKPRKAQRLVGCGRPWMGQVVRIVDPRSRRPVPDGAEGEIWVAGPAVARGYWGRRDETRRTFRAELATSDNSQEKTQGPFLRTGDLGLFDHGELYVTGRWKDLIILRGRNHYPQDFELSAEDAHPGIRAGCGAAFGVVVDGEERLVLVVEVERRPAGGPIDPEAVADAVRQAVAEDHEVAVHEVVLVRAATIPKTSSGKIRRRTCREQYLDGRLKVVATSASPGESPSREARPEGRIEPAALRSLGPEARRRALETWVRGQTARLAGRPAERIEPRTSLLAQGLDSLSLVELQHRAETDLGLVLPWSGLLEDASPADLAARLAEELESGNRGEPALPPLERTRETAGEHALSSGQRALWTLTRLAPRATAYHLALAGHSHDLEPEAFERAAARLEARHPLLRIRFGERSGQPFQEAARPFGGLAGFTREDGTAWSPERVVERLQEEADRPYDLESGPLVRLLVVRRADGSWSWVLAAHHLVADLWSMTVLVQDLAALYTSERTGAGVPQPPSATYFDWVRWLDARLAGPEGDRHREHWRDRLTSVPAYLELPTDRPYQPREDFDGDRLVRRLDPQLTAALERLARDRGATLHAVLLAGLQVLLHRATGQGSFVVGSPAAGREVAETTDVLGYFVNPLPLPADLSDDPSGGELVNRARRSVFDGLEHQALPFPEIVELLGTDRNPGRTPLIQAVLAVQRVQGAPDAAELSACALGWGGVAVSLGELGWESVALAEHGAPFELNLMAAHWGDRLGLKLQYRTALWDRTSAQRWLERLEILLHALAAAPDRPVTELPWLAPGEHHQLVFEWNDTDRDLPADGTVSGLFEEHARAAPDTVALTTARGDGAPEVHLTYGRLDAEAEHLAGALRRRGVTPDVPVALCFERCPEMLVATLAVLKAGSAYLPLDPAYPEQRLEFLLADSGARLVLTHSTLDLALPPRARRAGVEVLCVDAPPASDRADVAPTEEPGSGAATALGLAYVMYTSGSSGRPKGVAVTHRGVVRLVRDNPYVRFGPEQVFLHLAPFSFDASTYEIWGALTHGGRLVLAPPGPPSLSGLAGLLEARRITSTLLTSGLFHQMAEAEPASLARVDQLVSGGDVMSPALAGRALARRDDGVLVNAYGPTETSVMISTHRMRPGDERSPELTAPGAKIPVGRPIANTRARVVDRRLRPVGIGVSGQIVASGPGLARGYLHRAALTAEVFVPDPFAAEPGGRLYLTGDRGRLLPGGSLDFQGRLDAQVKIRGFRIEPGEVEAALAALPQVEQAVVVVREGSSGDRSLVGYAVPAQGTEPSPEDLLRGLEGRLPSFMRPSAVMVLDALPLTAHGKVDRAALPEPLEATAPYTAPRTPLEAGLAELWAEVLDVDRVGLDDEFFALGGHSLRATRLVARIRETFGVELPLAAVFEQPTLGDLAQEVAREVAREVGGPEPGATPREGLPPVTPIPRRSEESTGSPIRSAWPLSFAQEGLWFLHRLAPESSAYNIPAGIALSGALDPAALRSALARVVERHEALRTRFEERDGEPWQRVAPPATPSLPYVDLTGLGERAHGAGRELAGRIARRAFDLRRDAPLRCLLLRLGTESHLLVLVLHHIVFDGRSAEILWRELGALYRPDEIDGSGTEGPVPELAELPIQYADYAVWQRQTVQGDLLESQLAVWRERLADPPELELPADRPRTATGTGRAGRVPVRLPAATATALAAAGRTRRTTLFVTLLAGFTAWLSRICGREDLTVGAPADLRRARELERLIGYFVNTMVIRTGAPRSWSFADLVDQVRDRVLEAQAHLDVPFERLVRELVPGTETSGARLFQAMLAFEPSALGAASWAGLEAEPVALESGAAKFDLTLSLELAGDALQGSFEYDADRFDRTTVIRWARSLEHLLREAAIRPEQTLSELPLLDAVERHQLLRAWLSGCDSPGPKGSATLHGLFAETAGQRPDAAALVSRSEVITYGALASRAAELAAHLTALGVAAEEPVGVLAERSVEGVTALLAVLEAGALFVPLEPSHPDQRLAALARDAGIRWLIGPHQRVEDLARSGASSGAKALRAVPPPAGTSGTRRAAPGVRHPSQLAYAIYTSGSTGRPKAVGVPHGAASTHVRGMARATYHLGPEDRSLLFSSLAFDPSIEQLFAAFAAGSAVYLPGVEPFEPAALSRSIARQRLTVVNLPASAWAEWVLDLDRAEVPDGTAGRDLRGSLRAVIAGSEPMPPATAARFRELFGDDVRLANAYGPTEAVISATVAWIDRPPERLRRLVRAPIGRALGQDRTVVVDAELRPVPVGVTGELAIGGPGLARGYLGRPARTAAAFVPDPFAAEPGARLYRTGDRARWLSTGSLDLLGRLDEQVKVRGFRIEPGEIEAALAGTAGVGAAAVVAPVAPSGQRVLVAYFVPDEESPDRQEPEELRASLRRRLPEHLVPTVLEVVESLPRTPSGKVDRRALLSRGVPAAGLDRERSVAPRTPVEEILAAIYEDLLGVERVGAHDGFFELGGHSLLATRLVSRVRSAFDVELPVRRVFEHSTVSELASALAGLTQQSGQAAPPLVARERPAPKPDRDPGRDPHQAPVQLAPSFAQERMWFLARYAPESPGYTMAGGLRLRGPLDLSALGKALSGVVARHEALRTVFPEVEGRPVQEVRPVAAVDLPVVDLAGLPGTARSGESRRERELERVLRAEARRPFDLATGPLLRTTLVRLDRDEHALGAVMHHIVSDGWSVGVLLSEVAALYRGEKLPDLAIQYADYALWQREWLAGEVLKAQLGTWRRRLDGVPPLELPTDRPRPAERQGRGERVPVQLDRELWHALKAHCRAQSATPFMGLLAGLEMVLSRASGQDDFAVGTPVANRTREETEGLIGFFVNTLVLRSSVGSVEAQGSFATLLRRVAAGAREAYEAQELPFEKLVEELAPERDPSRTPLFQVMLALQNTPREPFDLPGLEATPLATSTGTATFDLTWSLAEAAGVGEIGNADAALEGTLAYDAALFDRTTAQRLARHLPTVLDAALAEPERPLRGLPLLAAAERHQILREGHGPHASVPRASVPELFLLRVAERPGAPAVESFDGTLSYGELERRSARLARRLVELGVGPEARVAVALERGTGLVVTLMATLRAGGVYVPVDPAEAPERRRRILEDAAPRVLVTEGPREAAGMTAPPGVLRAHPGDGPRSTAHGAPPAGPLGLSCLAYVLYTSGTTGRPKGVMVDHASLVGFVHWSASALFGAEGTTVPLLSRISFDASIKQLLTPLCLGRRVRIPPDDVLTSPGALLASIRPEDVLNCVPALWDSVVTAVESGLAAPALPRRVVLGGDRLPRRLVERTHALSPETEVINVYGPTETTCIATAARVLPGEAVTLGRPLPATRALALGPDLRPVPAGAPAELVLAGPGLARGYLGRPGTSAERFVPDPFGDAPGGRLYRTGDRVRRLADGRLEFLGRIDDQVKIRGFRIEPGEIEAALAEMAGVRTAAVVAPIARSRPSAQSGERTLVAYLVGEDASLDREAVSAALRQRLPEAMVPSAWEVVESLPLTPTGKVDRRALLARGVPAAGLDRNRHVAPRTPTEEVLAGLYGELLGAERVGADDGFFDLGGHSLLATRLVSKVRSAFGVELPVRQVFEHPTVSELAAAVAALTGEAGPAVPPLVARERPAPDPVRSSFRLAPSFAQERMWFLARYAPESPVYTMAGGLRLRGSLDLAALAGAVSGVVARHEVLRTVFPEAEGRPVQEVQPARDSDRPSLPVVDLTGLPQAARRERELERVLRSEARRPFDLAAGPLVRTALVRLDGTDHALATAMHHIVSDGWSVGILLSEVAALYRGEELPGLAIQYADYALWQRQWLAGDVMEAQLGTWRRRLDGVPPLELPTDRPRPAERQGRGERVPVRLEAELWHALGARCRERGATPFMGLLAGLELVLSRAAGQDDFAVGTPVANRTREETEGLIGFFVNTLVLRSAVGAVDARGTFDDLLDRVAAGARAAYEVQELPFEKLVEELAPERDPSRTPLFQVMLALQNTPRKPFDLPGLDAARLGTPTGTATFDLTWSLTEAAEAGAALEGSLEYDAALFDRTTVQRLGRQLRTVLAAAVAEPERPLRDLPLLTAAERHQAVIAWAVGRPQASRRASSGRGRTIPGLVWDRAEAQPDAVAVTDGATTLTYAALARRASSLAARLRAAGVSSGAAVAVAIGRSAELVVAELGVLWSGAVFLPLDVDWPEERTGYVLSDGAVTALVVDAVDTAAAALAEARGIPVVELAAPGETATGPVARRSRRPRPRRRRTPSTRPAPRAGPRASRCPTGA